ncbi:2-amino-4-hydroxy-6-hydroxymethyldihydropteridine diphosphokinase [Synechococcus moorigangaii CMS01]|nr:2-amino-4-hydroxy-6-hydroxymethyldihydropteridine diphosphokinase [Synechococcus moorigangaii CMS01]
MAQNRVYLSVASNIQPEANIFQAMMELKRFCRIKAVSRCFVTDAIPAPGQPPSKDLPYYINCVVLVETGHEAAAFKFDILRSLETKLGRIRTADKYAPRTLDLDILLFNDAVIQAENLVIPDPDIKKRWFLAQGLVDINPEISLPEDVQPLQIYLQPLLDNLAATNQTFTEDSALREKILAIA